MNDLEMAFYQEIRDSLQSFEQYLLKSISNPATDYPQPDQALHDAYVLLNGMDASESQINAIATLARRMGRCRALSFRFHRRRVRAFHWWKAARACQRQDW